MNNQANVREEAREQVLAAMKRLNSHACPRVSARSHRSCLVGLVYDNPGANTIEVQRGALARCREGKFLPLPSAPKFVWLAHTLVRHGSTAVAPPNGRR